MRKGLGKGRGMGYYNLVPKDPYVHSLSAKGVKSKTPRTNISVPKGWDDVAKRALEDSAKTLNMTEKAILNRLESGFPLTKSEFAFVKRMLAAEEKLLKDLSKKDISDFHKTRIKTRLKIIDTFTKSVDESGVLKGSHKLYAKSLSPKEQGMYDEGKAFLGPSLLDKQKKAVKKLVDTSKRAGVALKDEIHKKLEHDNLQRDYMKTMTDSEIKESAVREPQSLLWGINKFEKEWERRLEKRKELAEKEEIIEERPVKRSFMDDLFGVR